MKLWEKKTVKNYSTFTTKRCEIYKLLYSVQSLTPTYEADFSVKQMLMKTDGPSWSSSNDTRGSVGLGSHKNGPQNRHKVIQN